MAIRIRVYPQPGSIGARRAKAAKQQKLAVQRARIALIRQQQLLAQQQLMLQQQAWGMNSGFGGALSGYSTIGYNTGLGGLGYGSSYGTGYNTGYNGGFGAGVLVAPQVGACPPPASGLYGGYGGANFVTQRSFGQACGFGPSQSYQQVSPYGVSQYSSSAYGF